MLNVNNPSVVIIKITSPVADFQLAGQLGWQASVHLTHLPQYPLSEEDYYDRLTELLDDVSVVPLDNMAIADSAAVAVCKAHENAVLQFERDRLKGDVNASFVYEAEHNGKVIYRLEIMANERDLTPDVEGLLATF
jgi:hypothetical protein